MLTVERPHSSARGAIAKFEHTDEDTESLTNEHGAPKVTAQVEAEEEAKKGAEKKAVMEAKADAAVAMAAAEKEEEKKEVEEKAKEAEEKAAREAEAAAAAAAMAVAETEAKAKKQAEEKDQKDAEQKAKQEANEVEVKALKEWAVSGEEVTSLAVEAKEGSGAESIEALLVAWGLGHRTKVFSEEGYTLSNARSALIMGQKVLMADLRELKLPLGECRLIISRLEATANTSPQPALSKAQGLSGGSSSDFRA